VCIFVVWVHGSAAKNLQALQNLQKQVFAALAALAGFSVSGIIGGYSS